MLVRLLQKVASFDLAPDAQPDGTLPPADWAESKVGRESCERVRPVSSLTMSVKVCSVVSTHRASSQFAHLLTGRSLDPRPNEGQSHPFHVICRTLHISCTRMFQLAHSFISPCIQHLIIERTHLCFPFVLSYATRVMDLVLRTVTLLLVVRHNALCSGARMLDVSQTWSRCPFAELERLKEGERYVHEVRGM
jgi:hypothetical protein